MASRSYHGAVAGVHEDGLADLQPELDCWLLVGMGTGPDPSGLSYPLGTLRHVSRFAVSRTSDRDFTPETSDDGSICTVDEHSREPECGKDSKGTFTLETASPSWPKSSRPCKSQRKAPSKTHLDRGFLLSLGVFWRMKSSKLSWLALSSAILCSSVYRQKKPFEAKSAMWCTR